MELENKVTIYYNNGAVETYYCIDIDITKRYICIETKNEFITIPLDSILKMVDEKR